MQARTVILQASVPGSDPRIQPMSFTARVVPSTSPYGLLLFADEACTEAMPTEGSASNFQHILKQSAGEKVWVLVAWLASGCQDKKCTNPRLLLSTGDRICALQHCFSVF